MKRLFSLAAVLLFSTMLTSNAFAHSQMAESIPANNEVVTEPLNEIVLKFEGQIEQGSFIEVTSTSGQAVDIQEITIGEGTLTGTVATPLPNDDYQLNWSIISADGHPLEGEFTFTVDVPGSEATEELETTEAIEESTDTQLTEDQEATPGVDDVDEESSSSMNMILIVLIGVVLAGVFFFIFMKRKKK